MLVLSYEVNRRKNQLAIFLLTLIAVLGLSGFVAPKLANSREISQLDFVAPEWLNNHANDRNVRILDVRINPLDYINGHIPNAVHIADNTFRGPNGRLPIQYWDQQKIQSLFQQAGVNKGSHVVVYSDDANVLGATMIAYLLERSGHSRVSVLDGGYKGYKISGLPVTKEYPSYSLGDFTVNENLDTRVDLQQIRQHVSQKSNLVLIDPRPASLFAGEEDVFIRNGHIPGAKNIPWQSLTVGKDNLHQLLPLEQIQALVNRRGIKPQDDIVISCSTGREATLQYVVLKHLLNYPRVRVYEGSWTEYSAQADLPIEVGRDPEA